MGLAPAPGITKASSEQQLACFCKALADPTRVKVLQMLLEGEMCVCEIMEALPLSQPAVSHHLKVLRQASLLTDRRQGKWIYYDLDPAGLLAASNLFQEMLFGPVANRGTASWRHQQHPACNNLSGTGKITATESPNAKVL